MYNPSLFIINYYFNPCTLADLRVLSQQHSINKMFSRLSNAIVGFVAPILVVWVADASGYRFALSPMIAPLVFAVLMIYSIRAPNIISDKV